MYYVRAVNNANHFKPETFKPEKVEISIADQRPNSFTSVYKVADHAEAVRVVTLFVMQGKDRPESVDYVLIPELWLSETGILPVLNQDPNLTHTLLRSTHHDLHGLEQQATLENLVERFRQTNAPLTGRISKAQVVENAKREISRPDTGAEALGLIEGEEKGRWRVEIAKLPP